ncbi:MAG: WYL domain-containing protein [Prevotella sp.]|nr:WYL domain-containing protein [Prevotella sp.]
MPTVKNAFERYKVLDRCFRDRRRKYFINDLLEIVNKDIRYYYGTEISERTLREDIKYMQDSEGYSAPIAKGMVGHRVYYYYSNTEFSIMKLPMSQDEMTRLADTIQMLKRFKGMPDCDWMEETFARFEETFHLNNLPNGIVCFAQNPDLKGLKWFSPLYDAIIKKTVINILYAKFRGTPYLREIHPYQLKQYNNRWFLIGMEPQMVEKVPFVVIPLDRIHNVESADEFIYQEYKGIDLDDYFNQVVGVSINVEATREKILIKAEYPAAGYIETKPIHNSQSIVERTDNYIIFELNLIPNYEFETLLLGYMNECVILKPTHLKQKLLARIAKIISKNK